MEHKILSLPQNGETAAVTADSLKEVIVMNRAYYTRDAAVPASIKLRMKKKTIYDLGWDDIDVLEEIRDAFSAALELAEAWGLELSEDSLDEVEERITELEDAETDAEMDMRAEVNAANGRRRLW
ncbi:hypothetical protein AGMMS49992_20610 [Clostridia bacterium]|nr:hypothetical protein AGMMS49992_20610 [Clostridia bacterium]